MSYIFFGAKGALAKIKVGRTKRPTFILEQATRVELAGSSLGSCRHTARRRLLVFYALYYTPFFIACQRIFPTQIKKPSALLGFF